MTLENAKDVFITPLEAAKQKKEAAKLGKEIVPLISKNNAYQSVEEKIKKDKELANFLNQIHIQNG